MPLAGILCESEWGWPSLYYIQGILTLILFAVFYIFYRDDPFDHRYTVLENLLRKNIFSFVSDKEFKRIKQGKINMSSDKDAKKDPKVPYRKMFTDRIVWVVLIGIIGGQFGYLTLVQFGPVYLNKVQF